MYVLEKKSYVETKDYPSIDTLFMWVQLMKYGVSESDVLKPTDILTFFYLYKKQKKKIHFKAEISFSIKLSFELYLVKIEEKQRI